MFLAALQRAHATGQLQFFGALSELSHPEAFARYLAPLKRTAWVVYAKAPMAGPHQVLEYLGRYTHRVAISNSRLRALENDQVTFDWKDYRDGDQKQMKLASDVFIRRFLTYALPPGFQRIRYYGLLASCHRATRLALCRRLLACPVAELLPCAADYRTLFQALVGIDLPACPKCGRGPLLLLPFPRPVDSS